MQPTQELTKLQKVGLPQLAGDQILGLVKKTKQQSKELTLTYQPNAELNQSQIEKAFDILFEETLLQMGNLTSYDN